MPVATLLPRAARVVVALSLLALAFLKLVSLSTMHSHAPNSLSDVVASRGAVGTAASIELDLGDLLLGTSNRWGARAVLIWTAAVSGVFVALVLRDQHLSPCGCLGQIEAPWTVRAAILGGIALLAWIADDQKPMETAVPA